jgi:hypothetical protein
MFSRITVSWLPSGDTKADPEREPASTDSGIYA